MTLHERLRAHRGGLVRIESELFWYGRGWDGNPGRICLVLDATAGPAAAAAADAPTRAAAAAVAAAHLLVDGSPHWIWVSEANIEILDGGDR